MSTENVASASLPPLTYVEYYILLSMLNAPRHGLSIFEEVARFTSNQMVLSPGTLYAALKRMNIAGWITMVSPGDERYDPDERRKVYAVTETGLEIFAKQMYWLEQEALRAREAFTQRSADSQDEDSSESGSGGDQISPSGNGPSSSAHAGDAGDRPLLLAQV